MWEYYQNLPLCIDPIAFTIGSFSIRWYALSYVVAGTVIYYLLAYRIKKEKLASLGIANETRLDRLALNDLSMDYLMLVFVGALIGGRLGYVFLYNPIYYIQHWVEIFSPYDFFRKEFIGIYGMSYHGGLLGVGVTTWIFVKKNELNFWKWLDFVVPAVPAGYFFGRIGNFLNGELYGRVTVSSWGMYFSDTANELRFPSQIIEALLEGGLLFVVLWLLRMKSLAHGQLVSVYLLGYGMARFASEFFRQPDSHLGYVMGFLTLGQVLSLIMVLVGVGSWMIFQKNTNKV